MMTGLPCAAVRPSAAPAENEHNARERILIELPFAQGGERIDVLSEIDRFADKQNLELRNELNHRAQKLRKLEQRVEIEASVRLGRKMESLAPSGRSRRTRQSFRACRGEEETSG